MKTTMTFGLFLLSLFTFGQRPTDEQINNTGMSKLNFVENENAADSLAKLDIKNGIPILLLQSGDSPISYLADKDFEEKYKTFYYDYGCVGPNEKLATVYNKATFEYLTKNYGRKWTREIRKDVIGFRKWRRTRK